MLKSFKEFIFEKVVISDNFLKTIADINHPIANYIYHWYSKNNKDDFYDSVELDELPLLLAAKGTKFEKIKIGKFLRKILPVNFKPHDIEEFINLIRKKSLEIGDFEILKGQDIKKAYLPSNFSTIKVGTLWTSCLSKENRQENLQLYCDNSNISVIVLYDNASKIIGRALLWKAIYEGKSVMLMDDVYSIDFKDTSISKKFLYFANENEFLHVNLAKNSAFDGLGFESPNEFIVTLQKADYEKYPFVDFMQYISVSEKYLSNKNGEYSLQKAGKDKDFGNLACKTCHGKKTILCPDCEGTGKDKDGHACKRCGGDYTFIDCPDC